VVLNLGEIMFMLFLACAGEEIPSQQINQPPTDQQNTEIVAEPSIDEEKPVNEIPIIKEAKFSIEEPTTKDQIKVDVVASDPEGLPLRYDYAWKVNGKSFHSETREFLRKVKVNKGDKIEVTITATDGVSEAKRTISNTVVNAPPEWDPDPRNIKEINGFQVSAIDPDGDKLIYKLEGAPSGMAISSSGVLSYTGSEEEPGGQYTIGVIAEDPQKDQVKWQFSISLSAGSAAKK
jgi:hypothetical protein